MQGITFLANEHLEVGHKIADGKRKKTCHMTCLFSNRQLSILPGRFQPSTFDV